MILTSEADARGRTGFEENPYPQGDYLRQAYQVANAVSIKEVVASGLQGHRDPRRAQTSPPAGAGRLETQPNDYQRSGIKKPRRAGFFLGVGLTGIPCKPRLPR